ncbi:MAG: hypothetical protein ACE5LU_15090 [Anaerolineae bacterium]
MKRKVLMVELFTLYALRITHYASRITHHASRFTLTLWLAGLVTTIVACRPTGPTPVRFTVPTAIRHTPTSVALTPAVQASPTGPLLSPEVPALPPTELAPTMPELTSVGLVTQAGWNALSLVPGGRILAPTAGHDSILWVASAGSGLGLYVHNLRTDKTRSLAGPSTPGGCVCRGYRRGDWIVMVEAEPGATWWEVSALNLATDLHVAVGRTDDPATLSALRPSEIAVNAEGQIVWKDVATSAGGSVVETLRLHNARTGEVSDIISVRSPVGIGQMTMYGDWVVWSQATEGEAGTRGDVFAYNVRSDALFPIGETGRAWEPAIWGTTVVWKHADGPFADGDVFLFDLETGEGRLLTAGGEVSQVGVGDGFVVWSSASAGVVVRRDLQADTDEVIGRGAVGRLAAGANTVVWLLDDDPGTLYIAWKR